MKILDLYIIKKFLTTFVFILGIIMAIAMLFDFAEKLDDFIRGTAPFKAIILDYYVNFIIFYGNLFASLITFIACIYFTSNLAGKTEIVAILSSGISFNRMLVPFFVVAAILCSISMGFNHWLLPKANMKRVEFEDTYFHSPYKNYEKHIHRQVIPNEFMYFDNYNVARETGYKFSYETWDNGKLIFKMHADFLSWDSINELWTAHNYIIRKLKGYDKDSIVKGEKLDTTFMFYPSDFNKYYESNIQMMNTAELNQFIEAEKLRGSDLIAYYEIEKHQRTSYPMATFILTLLGVSLSSRKVRGGTGLHLALGLLIVVLYILFMKVTTVYATNAGVNPLLAVWIPNFIFGLLSIYIYNKAPK